MAWVPHARPWPHQHRVRSCSASRPCAPRGRPSQMPQTGGLQQTSVSLQLRKLEVQDLGPGRVDFPEDLKGGVGSSLSPWLAADALLLCLWVVVLCLTQPCCLSLCVLISPSFEDTAQTRVESTLMTCISTQLPLQRPYFKYTHILRGERSGGQRMNFGGHSRSLTSLFCRTIKGSH